MRKLGLAYKILIGMVLGAIIGFIVGPSIAVISPLGTIFIRLLRMTILPLIFFSVTSGVASIADLNRLKKVGGVFTGYWAISSLLAASTGIFWALIIKPGVGINLPVSEKMDVNVDLLDSVIKWIPDNVPKAFADGNIIQVIVFAMFAGITAALLAKTEPGQRMIELFTAGDKLMSRMVGIVMNVAPYGVFALMANVTGTLGTIALKGIGKMLLTQYVAYATVLLIFYPIILKLMARVNPVNHYKNIFPAMVMAFSTQSSSATIPVTMDCTKRRAGVPDDIVNLITAPAATINMHACAAEMPIYALFASQIYNIPLSIPNFITICILGVIMAAGVAGVPGGGIMMSAVLLQIMGLPLDIVPWIAGVYVLIDMPNTMLNVTGDTVGMVYTAAKLGELDRETFDRPKPISTK